jgi:hypothetical protein
MPGDRRGARPGAVRAAIRDLGSDWSKPGWLRSSIWPLRCAGFASSVRRHRGESGGGRSEKRRRSLRLHAPVPESLPVSVVLGLLFLGDGLATFSIPRAPGRSSSRSWARSATTGSPCTRSSCTLRAAPRARPNRTARAIPESTAARPTRTSSCGASGAAPAADARACVKGGTGSRVVAGSATWTIGHDDRANRISN